MLHYRVIIIRSCKTTTTATITSKKVLSFSGLCKVKSPFAVSYERCEYLTKNIQVIEISPTINKLSALRNCESTRIGSTNNVFTAVDVRPGIDIPVLL